MKLLLLFIPVNEVLGRGHTELHQTQPQLYRRSSHPSGRRTLPGTVTAQGVRAELHKLPREPRLSLPGGSETSVLSLEGQGGGHTRKRRKGGRAGGGVRRGNGEGKDLEVGKYRADLENCSCAQKDPQMRGWGLGEGWCLRGMLGWILIMQQGSFSAGHRATW